jgi:hypothetical protein
MKINQIKNKKRVDEIDLGNLMNKLRGHPTMTSTQKKAKDLFLKGFVSKVVGGLDSAIKSGLVSATPTAPSTTPTIPTAPSTTPTTPTAPSTTPTTPTAPSTTPTTPTAPSTAPAKANYQKQQQQTQNMNQYIQAAAKTINTTSNKAQKIALTKELVNYMADRKGYPEWQNGLATVNQVIKKGNVDPNFANAALAKIKTGQRMAEAWKIFYINKLIESVGLTWKDLGLTVLQESTSKKYYIAETKYLKLNTIFEGIINLDETPTQQSISQYVTNYTNKYIGDNPNFKPYQANIQQLATRVEQEYSRDRGNKALIDLANLIYSMVESVPRNSSGAAGAAVSAAAGTGGTGGTGGINQLQGRTTRELQMNQAIIALLAKATEDQKEKAIRLLASLGLTVS